MEEAVINNAEGGQFAYKPYKKGYLIKRYRGIGERIQVPSHIDEKPVISIEKKAFLSCKTIREIILPDTVEEIGDWAFAHAEQLRTVSMPHHALIHGKELFLGCKRLREISIRTISEEETAKLQSEGLWRMLAMAVTVFHDYFLFDPMEIGSDAWVKRWDEKLIGLVALDDLDGFEELWTCGEEDYEGKDYDIKSYPVEKRKMKLRLVYFRLLHPYKLSDSVQEELLGYLRRHTKGTMEPEAWDIILEEHTNELNYYQIFVNAGCVNADNFDSLLSDMGNVGAEIKAYLLRYKEEHLAPKDAFSAFTLDW